VALVANGLTRPGGLLVTSGLGTTTPAPPGSVVAHLYGTGAVYAFLSSFEVTGTYLFLPPTIIEGYGLGALIRGVSVWFKGGEWFEQIRPSDYQLVDADPIYLGGHEYLIDGAAAQALMDAGYVPVPVVEEASTFGSGPYGSGPYGGS
jgi:hypothetical protein